MRRLASQLKIASVRERFELSLHTRHYLGDDYVWIALDLVG